MPEFKKNKSAFMMKGKSPMMKALIGKQKNLPEELKEKILASPSKMYGKKHSPAKNYMNPQEYKVFNMGNPVKMYGKKHSPAKGYKSDAQRKAVHASKAEKAAATKMYGKKKK